MSENTPEHSPAPAASPPQTFAELVKQFVPRPHPATTILMLFNVAMFAASTWQAGRHSISWAGFDERTLRELGAMEAVEFAGGQTWRLITAGFLHGNLLHLLLNLLNLYFVGNDVEEFFRKPRYLAIYVFSACAGFLTSYGANNFLLVGASASIFGLLGALVAYAILKRNDEDRKFYIRAAYYTFVLTLLISVLLSFLPVGRNIGIDHAAHAGGLAGGFVIGWLAGLPRPTLDWRERLWQGIGLCSVGLVVLSYLTWVRRYVL